MKVGFYLSIGDGCDCKPPDLSIGEMSASLWQRSTPKIEFRNYDPYGYLRSQLTE